MRSAEFKEIEASYDDLDPEVAAQRQRDMQKANRRLQAMLAQADRDTISLIEDPRFIRFLFTIAERAGILQSSFLPQKGLSDYNAGWRGLGLAIISPLEALDPGLWVRIMMERAKTLEKMNDDASRTAERSDAE